MPDDDETWFERHDRAVNIACFVWIAITLLYILAHLIAWSLRA